MAKVKYLFIIFPSLNKLTQLCFVKNIATLIMAEKLSNFNVKKQAFTDFNRYIYER